MENKEMYLLVKRIHQQENIVNQLMKIIASTNSRIVNLEKRQQSIEKSFLKMR